MSERAGVTSLEGKTPKVSTCKDYIIGREITAVHRLLNIAVNIVMLEMLESCDYLPAGSHSWHKPITFNRDFYLKKITVITSIQVVEC